MKMKGLAAAVLAGLTLLGAAPSASARHLAEEYMEAVQREKAERARMERERAERQRLTSRRRREEKRPQPPMSSNGEELDDAWQDEERKGQDAAAEAAGVTERPEAGADGGAARGTDGAEEERAAAMKDAREAEAETAKDEMVDWHRREGDEKRQTEEPRAGEKEGPAKETEAPPLVDFSQNGAKEAKAEKQAEQQDLRSPAAKEEGVLAKYLRRARERAEGILAPQNAPPTESGANILHVAKPETMKELAVDKTDTGGILLFSDSPEYVREPGILYSDVVKGDVRVFYYHLNDTKKPYKVAVVLENDSGQFSVLSVTRSAMAAPSDDYFAVGRGLQEIYFGDGHRPEKLYIGSGEKRLLSEEMDRTILKPGELTSGVFDFSASAPLRVSVLFYPTGENPLEFIKEAKVLPNDEHRLRGTFVGTDRVIRARRAYNPGRDGLRYITICDGEKDVFLKGVDATDGRLAENVGNYGVVYRMEIPVAGGKTMRAFMSPMGGSYSGVVRAEKKKEPGFSLFGVPDGESCFGENSCPKTERDGLTHLEPSGDLAELGVYRGKTEAFFEMSPPGASNLPVLLILAPDDIVLRKGTPKEPKAK